tara:strand:+ start:422 stop:1573 length:1152 start_codon:yes stop_codon:yes gene_type:complete
MAYNGTGTFSRIYNWTTDAANGINIEAVRMDREDNGFAVGLSNAITKDGQTTITANIPFNSKKITGLANGSARTDSIALGQVQDGTYRTLGTLGGSADTYTATPSPAITAYATGSEFNLKVNADNTGASTLNVNAVAAKAIKKYDGAGAKLALEAGDLQQDQYYKVIYDGTDFILVNPEIIDNLKSNKLNTQPNSTTISSGAIAYTGAYMVVDTEGAAASDDLVTISGGVNGDRLTLRTLNNGRDVVLKHSTGNIFNIRGDDIVVGNTGDVIELIYNGTFWVVSSNYKYTDFLNSKSTSGYTYLPNGLIFQWGIKSSMAATSTSVVTLPIAFPTAIIHGAVSTQGVHSTYQTSTLISLTSLSQVTLSNASGGVASLFWQAKGY